MKTTNASCWIQVVCTCPYCGAFEDIFDNDTVKESMDEYHSADNCDIEIRCSECKEIFLVENITF